MKRLVWFHDLRHTCASHLLMGSWGSAWRLEEVRDFLGHESITSTQRYAHLSQDHLQKKALLMNEIHYNMNGTKNGGQSSQPMYSDRLLQEKETAMNLISPNVAHTQPTNLQMFLGGNENPRREGGMGPLGFEPRTNGLKGRCSTG